MKTSKVIPGAASLPDVLPSERKSGDTESPVSPADRATLAQTEKLKASISSNVNMATSERAERIHALTQQVQAGVYRPNSSQLADQLLAEAQLDAHLARALG